MRVIRCTRVSCFSGGEGGRGVQIDCGLGRVRDTQVSWQRWPLTFDSRLAVVECASRLFPQLCPVFFDGPEARANKITTLLGWNICTWKIIIATWGLLFEKAVTNLLFGWRFGHGLNFTFQVWFEYNPNYIFAYGQMSTLSPDFIFDLFIRPSTWRGSALNCKIWLTRLNELTHVRA